MSLCSIFQEFSVICGFSFLFTTSSFFFKILSTFHAYDFFHCSDRTLYQLRSDPSIHDRQRDLSFTRKSSIRQKSRRDRVRRPEGKVEVSSDKPEEKVPDIEDSEVKITDEDYEEIEIEKPYDDRYVSNVERELLIHSLLWKHCNGFLIFFPVGLKRAIELGPRSCVVGCEFVLIFVLQLPIALNIFGVDGRGLLEHPRSQCQK